MGYNNQPGMVSSSTQSCASASAMQLEDTIERLAIKLAELFEVYSPGAKQSLDKPCEPPKGLEPSKSPLTERLDKSVQKLNALIDNVVDFKCRCDL